MPAKTVVLCYNEFSRFFYINDDPGHKGSREDNFCMECSSREEAAMVAELIDKSFCLDRSKRRYHMHEIIRTCIALRRFLDWHKNAIISGPAKKIQGELF